MPRIEDVACIICDSRSNTLVYDRGRNKKVFNTVSCTTCGFVFISPRRRAPSDDEIQAYYQKGGYRNPKGKQRDPASPERVKKAIGVKERARRRYRNICETQPRLVHKKGRVLDIGTNLGHFLGFMRLLECLSPPQKIPWSLGQAWLHFLQESPWLS